MNEEVQERIRRAAAAGEGETGHFVHDPSPEVVRALLGNRNVSEQDVLIIAGRKNLPGDLLDLVAKDRRWSESYPLRLALAKNPKTPLFTALTIARYLRLPDLAALAHSRALPLVYRHKLEALLTEKIPTLPLGVKRTLAKTAAGSTLAKLLEEEDGEIVRSCLANPGMTEAHLFAVIRRGTTPAPTIRAIAEHPKWSTRYTLRLGLARNPHTPLAQAVAFFQDLKTRDLQELFRDPSVPVTVKPYLHSELAERGACAEGERAEEQPLYEIVEEPGLETDEWAGQHTVREEPEGVDSTAEDQTVDTDTRQDE